MLSSLARLITRTRLSLSLIQQQCLLTSTSTSNTHENTNKNDLDLHIDTSTTPGPITLEERTAWMKKEQGFSFDIQTGQERKPRSDPRNNANTKRSNN